MAPDASIQTDEARTVPAPPPPTQGTQTQPPNTQQPGFQQYQHSYGQPFAPYQQLAYVQQPGQQLTRPEVPHNKGWEITKLALHGVSAICCIVGLGLTISLFASAYSGLLGIIFCPVLVAALLWDISEIITRWVRKFKAGIHPGAHVAVSLLIWLGASITGSLEAVLISFDARDDSPSCTHDENDEYTCENSYSSRLSKVIAVAVFTCLVWLCHFILFVFACMDTAKRNALTRQRITMVVNGPPYWGPGAQGFQQMPQYYGPPAHMQSQNIPMQNRAPSPGSGNGKDAITTAQPTLQRYA
ncbi:hypothetical protein FZEAL_6518 [Fusarium zealandicum]|uniref:MARVEL domain-containing protein n=1 Tax=Fusarium zealandicum TaxID=1053134 RepID=A0A8H4UHR5_9HYPO|nr:hypothetical protein FZEAL_6518 [Fusarium zealandicum]